MGDRIWVQRLGRRRLLVLGSAAAASLSRVVPRLAGAQDTPPPTPLMFERLPCPRRIRAVATLAAALRRSNRRA